jgi:hypothetical protein
VVVDEAIHSSRELSDTRIANETGRPVFCPYGTGSTNPSSGGFIYGGYLRTHNIIGTRNAALKAQQRRRRTGAESAPGTPRQAAAAAAGGAARAPSSTVAAGAAAALRSPGRQAIRSAPTPAAAAAAAAQKGALAAQQQAQDKKAAAVAAVEKAKKSVAAATATGAKAKQAAAKAKQTAATAAAIAAAAVDTSRLPKDTRPPEAPPATVEPPLDPAEAAELDAFINPPYVVRPLPKDFAIIAQVVPAGMPTPRSDHVPDCLNFSLTGSSTSSGSSGSTGVLGRRTSRVAWAPTQVLTQEFARGG